MTSPREEPPVHLDGAGEPVHWMQRCGPLSQDDVLGSAYLAALGVKSLVERIHPEDEMMLDFQLLTAADKSARVEYFRSGIEAVLAIENVLASAGRSWADVGSVLEFACGFGRVTRFLVDAVGAERVVGCEILADAVPFAAEAFGVRVLRSTTRPADLDLGGPYDLVFVGSLFSHLPRKRFAPWLAKLYEVLSLDGLLVFSTHGERVYPDVPKHRSGFTFVRRSESRTLSKAEYGATFVRPDVVARLAEAAGVAHLATAERDLWKVQDLHVASRAAVPGLAGWGSTSYVRGSIDLVHWAPSRRLRVYGWSADPCPTERVEAVELLLDGRPLATARPETERPDVAEDHGRPDLLRSGYFVDVAPDAPPGPHVLTARGRSSSGRDMPFDVRLVRIP